MCKHWSSGCINKNSLTSGKPWLENGEKYPWLYHSVVHQGYLCKFCELFCGHSSSSQECFTVGINLGTLWWTPFVCAERRTTDATNQKTTKWITSALNPTCLLQSALNPTCLLQVNDCPTHLYMGSGPLYLGKLARKWCESDKGSSSINDNMITFNGIYVLNFKFKRYSL
jgi:hypothetical protein